MLSTGVVLDPRYAEHDPGPGHPERPARISALLEAVERLGRERLAHVAPRAATREELLLVHAPGHVDRVAATAGHDFVALDPDTTVSAQSYATALLAAGGLLALVDAVMAGEADNGFALVRPPGHHAEADRAMGFCLFNNVAIAARYAQKRHGLERVAIVDWDVHHGNGSQHSFAADPSVLYVSTHEYPYYPGTGAAAEVGEGAGEGFTVNVPLAAGCGDPEYLAVFTEVIEPVLRSFAPQLVLVSAGFDAHVRDPLAGMRMTTAGYGLLTRVLLRVAAESAGGRLLAVLEGGYDLEALTGSVAAVLDELGGERVAEPLPAGSEPAMLARVKEIQRRYWDLP